jgi:cytochrome c oxidase assembly factor CtaG
MRAPVQLRPAALAAGLFVAAAAVLSPLDAWGVRSFAAHMAQHLLLIVVAAPLIAWSWPERVLPRWLRSAEAGWAAAAFFAVAILFWHLPAAHDFALADPFVHWIEHLSVLVAAVAFWRLVVFGGAVALGRGTALLLVWLVSLQGALLSAIIMFAPSQLCGSYAGNPIEDQVLAGLMMCIPASLVYFGTTVWALARLIRDPQSHAR